MKAVRAQKTNLYIFWNFICFVFSKGQSICRLKKIKKHVFWPCAYNKLHRGVSWNNSELFCSIIKIFAQFQVVLQQLLNNFCDSSSLKKKIMSQFTLLLPEKPQRPIMHCTVWSFRFVLKCLIFMYFVAIIYQVWLEKNI